MAPMLAGVPTAWCGRHDRGVPEGHTIHRLARRHARLLVGQRVAADSPQGRFEDGAAPAGRPGAGATDAWGKHLFHRYDDLWLHVHLGLYGKFRDGVAARPPAPRGAATAAGR